MLPHFIQEILAMLRCPNPDDPLVPEIARQWMDHPALFKESAR